MELKQGKISITYEELSGIRKMGKSQLEQYLTGAMEIGYRQGYTVSEAETDEELKLAEADKAAEISQALEENNRKWLKAVRDVVGAAKGIGRKRKELLLEYLKIELEKVGICRR